MKITVVCAGGKEGRLLVKEARDRGHEVTAVVRSSASAPKADKVLVKNLFQLTRGDVRGSDAVIDAFGAWTEETLPLHSTSLKHLCDIVSDIKKELLSEQLEEIWRNGLETPWQQRIVYGILLDKDELIQFGRP